MTTEIKNQICHCHDNFGIADNPVPDDVLATLAKVSTTTIWGELNRAGIKNTFMEGVLPRTTKYGFAGTAFTLRTLPPRKDVIDAQRGKPQPHRNTFATIGKNQVAVIDARGLHGTGVLGDNFAASILSRGGVALVTDGAVRDLPAMEEVGLPVYTPAGVAGAFGELHMGAELNVPIQCAGVLVLPGDVLVGDGQGVIVIPQAMAAEVAEKGLEVEIRDSYSRDRILEGHSLEGAFPMGDEMKAEYAEWRKSHPNG